ncbi:hypothetical protein MKW94_012852 [Papaver nudicaule]|uniref:Fe2OG dioxygenase domain-containing protein n=1 Tax=Papaver nudicaule TaxID=74823 RepID=A0AA41RQH7_PAPNU|nr:hypothetical protein [Papaver nudicaule]
MEVALENGEKIFLTYDDSSYDRMKELKVFDDAKAGVKGIADSRLSKIPRIFVRPAEELAAEEKLLVVNNGSSELHESTPVIDLQGLEDRRKEIVDEVRYAAETWGFFQLLNHGIPQTVMDDMEKGFTRFHEQDTEIKKQFYTRDFSKRVKLNTNFDLFVTNAARWKDTLNCSMLAPDPINPQELPDACRDEILDYTKHVIKVGDTLMELLSESLGLNRDHLKNMDCAKFLSVIGHYYPPCPQPELTLGASKHSDPTFITVLSKGEVDGLQIFYQDRWVAIRPLPGALIINIGDLLQVLDIFNCHDIYLQVPTYN